MSSWVEYAADTDFPIQNIPFGVFQTGPADAPRCATAIGDFVVDLAALQAAGCFNGPVLKGSSCFSETSLNAFMAMGRPAWREARETLQKLFSAAEPALRDNAELRAKAVLPKASVTMVLPARIGDYTDFYASREHATNVGKLFRPDGNPLLPNWLHLPVGYHGRSSSVVVTGTPLRRPRGQTKADDAPAPSFTACRLLDFELEMGFFVGPGNALGDPITIGEAENHIFGMVLLNDWSARDLQKWEYVPLGPFGAKNFGSTISPWVVTMDALEEFRVDGPAQVDPAPLPYLANKKPCAYNVSLEVAIQTPTSPEPHVVTRSNLRYMYWSLTQMLTHHSITGCNMQPGDLLGTGTISGPEEGSYGSLLEITWRGTKPISFPSGDERKFIQDNDIVHMRGFCQGNGYRIGFGECVGQILPAHPLERI